MYYGKREVSDKAFLRRRYVFAMVNENDSNDGFALVCPTRRVDSVSDLTELEFLEMFVCAQELSKKFEEMFKHIKSFQFVLQDGTIEGRGGICLKVLPESRYASHYTVEEQVNTYSSFFKKEGGARVSARI